MGVREGEVAEDDILAYLAPWTDPAAVPAFFRWARSIDGLGLRELEGPMRAWDLPTLILWGEDDPFHPSAVGERLNDAIPSSALGLVPDTGHFLPGGGARDDLSDHLGVLTCQLSSDTCTGTPPTARSWCRSGSRGRCFEDDDDDDDEPVVRDDQEVGPNA